MNGKVSEQTACLGHVFKDAKLLATALTHRSAGGQHNERLEYLGDALLGFIIAEALYVRFPDEPEGSLTRIRATLVKRETLARLARDRELGNRLRLGGGELKSGGWRRDSILANALEAVVGAIYLDAGFEACRQCVLRLYHDLLHEISPSSIHKDPKTELQEFLQARQLPLPAYRVVCEEGEAHDRVFTVECRVLGLREAVIAHGRNKRAAEQAAAQLALNQLRANE